VKCTVEIFFTKYIDVAMDKNIFENQAA